MARVADIDPDELRTQLVAAGLTARTTRAFLDGSLRELIEAHGILGAYQLIDPAVDELHSDHVVLNGERFDCGDLLNGAVRITAFLVERLAEVTGTSSDDVLDQLVTLIEALLDGADLDAGDVATVLNSAE